MKKYRLRLRIKVYPLLWGGILLTAFYLLIRFAALSFTENIGQADQGFQDAVLSYLCSTVIESGSSLVRYQSENELVAYTFPLSLATNKFALQDFVQDNSLLTVKAQETSSLPNNDQTKIAKGEAEASSKTDETQVVPQDSKLQDIIDYQDITSQALSREYVLTNGASFFLSGTNTLLGAATSKENGDSNQLQIGYLEGDLYYEEKEENASAEEDASVETVNPGNVIDYTLEQLNDVNFLVRHFYIIDPSTKITDDLFKADVLLGKDMTMKQDNEKPQILIYHTHSQEAYVDSKEGEKSDTVVGIGSYLTTILEEEYGYNVIHDTSCYDYVDRNIAYNKAEDGIEKILKDNPSIEVVLDIHRDGVEKRSTIIDGEETAQIMLFNGLSRDQNGPITYLDNPYLQDNLAFSLQLQLKSLDLYPGLFYKNYLECYRYNMHVRPKCILMELGTYKNTLQSAKNAMEPFAEILDSVLQGK